MAVLEISCYRVSKTVSHSNSHPWLKDAPYDKPTALLRHCLTEGLRASCRASKCEHRLLQDMRDTHTLWHLGRWTTLTAFEDYSKSEEHMLLLRALECCNVKRDRTVLYEAGIGEQHHTLHFLLSFFGKGQMPSHAAIVTISRYNVTETNNEQFRSHWADIRAHLHHSTGYEPVIGRKLTTELEIGIDNIDATGAQDITVEKYIVLCGWSSREEYERLTGFGRVPQLQQFRLWARQWDESCAYMIALE